MPAFADMYKILTACGPFGLLLMWLSVNVCHSTLRFETNEILREMERSAKFQVMAENCRKISRYARQEFHLMTESSA